MATAEVQSATAALVEEVLEIHAPVHTKEAVEIELPKVEEALEKVTIATDAAAETTPAEADTDYEVETEAVSEEELPQAVVLEPPAAAAPAPAVSHVAGDPRVEEEEKEEEDKAPAA